MKSLLGRKYVENLIRKLVDKKFKEAEKQGHKVFEQDKQILIDNLMWKYEELVEKISKLKWEIIEEKIDKLSRELDKVEYKEIIERLENYKEKVLKEKGKAPKK